MTIDTTAYPNTSGFIINNLLGVVANVESTSKDTGSMQVVGGIGVSGNIWANAVYAGTVNVVGIATYENLQAGNISALANLFVIGNLVVSGNTYQTGNIIFTSPGTLNLGPNSVVPKSYIDSVSVIFGV